MAKTFLYIRTQICYAHPARDSDRSLAIRKLFKRPREARLGATGARLAEKPVADQRVKVAQMRKTPGGEFCASVHFPAKNDRSAPAAGAMMFDPISGRTGRRDFARTALVGPAGPAARFVAVFFVAGTAGPTNLARICGRKFDAFSAHPAPAGKSRPGMFGVRRRAKTPNFEPPCGTPDRGAKLNASRRNDLTAFAAQML